MLFKYIVIFNGVSLTLFRLKCMERANDDLASMIRM